MYEDPLLGPGVKAGREVIRIDYVIIQAVTFNAPMFSASAPEAILKRLEGLSLQQDNCLEKTSRLE